MSALNSQYIYWCISLVVIVPLLIVFLNECIDRSRRGVGRYVHVLMMVRDIILPLMVAVVLLRFVFTVSDENVPTRILSTVFWLALMVAVFRFARRIIGSGSYSKDDWRNLVPHMFLRLPPYTIMGFIIFHIVQNLWSLPVREMATTLGIGSIVIAFALQDTLSNLVSGLLLVANSPFKTGDWVHVGDVEGKITAINWRYTNMETWSGDLVVIPNGSIAGESIVNHSRPAPRTSAGQKFTLSFEHSPTKVKAMFEEVFKNTPGILDDPAPDVWVCNIDDPTMEYEVEFWVKDYEIKDDVHAEFMTRMWYALRRHGITLPTPVYNVNTFRGDNINTESDQRVAEHAACLEWMPCFSLLPPATRSLLATAITYKPYAGDEIIINKNEVEPGVLVVLSGSVSLSAPGSRGEFQVVATLNIGDMFGETGLFGRAVSPVTAMAMEDTEILCIPHDLVNDAINRNPDFAAEINVIVEQRRLQENGITRGTDKDSAAMLVEHAGESS